jgi:hypothetical protein
MRSSVSLEWSIRKEFSASSEFRHFARGQARRHCVLDCRTAGPLNLGRSIFGIEVKTD